MLVLDLTGLEVEPFVYLRGSSEHSSGVKDILQSWQLEKLDKGEKSM